jgi:hypothetical protein
MFWTGRMLVSGTEKHGIDMIVNMAAVLSATGER